MKNVSTGFGLCVLGLGIAAWPVLDRLVPQANAVGIASTAPTVATAALAQGGPASESTSTPCGRRARPCWRTPA
jgi:hypothetical protein